MARPTNKRPENLGLTLRTLSRYMGRHTVLMVIVGVLAAVSALANLLGTYMIRPVVNSLADGDYASLVRGVVIAAIIYGTGAWQKGEIKNTPAYEEAYQAGKHC